MWQLSPPTFRVILHFSWLSPTTQIPRSFQLCLTSVLHIFAVPKTFGQTSTTTPRLIPGLAHYAWVNKQFHSFQIQTLLIVNGNEDVLANEKPMTNGSEMATSKYRRTVVIMPQTLSSQKQENKASLSAGYRHVLTSRWSRAVMKIIAQFRTLINIYCCR